MSQKPRKPVAPLYAVGILWLVYSLVLPLFRASHYVMLGVLSVIVSKLVKKLCSAGPIEEEKKATAPTGNPAAKQPGQTQNQDAKTPPASAKQEEPEDEPTGNPEIDKMLKDGRMAIQEMKRLDANIEDIGISADIVQMEQLSRKIFDEVKRDPKKLPQIRRFMDYYLPTTLKLLNAYDRATSVGISGENINATKTKVEAMMRNIVGAFEKQLDSLYGAEAMDISTDITVLETMMAREGLTGVGFSPDNRGGPAASPKPEKGEGEGITLEL